MYKGMQVVRDWLVSGVEAASSWTDVPIGSAQPAYAFYVFINQVGLRLFISLDCALYTKYPWVEEWKESQRLLFHPNNDGWNSDPVIAERFREGESSYDRENGQSRYVYYYDLPISNWWICQHKQCYLFKGLTYSKHQWLGMGILRRNINVNR